jgi:hypothetical protein
MAIDREQRAVSSQEALLARELANPLSIFEAWLEGYRRRLELVYEGSKSTELRGRLQVERHPKAEPPRKIREEDAKECDQVAGGSE